MVTCGTSDSDQAGVRCNAHCRRQQACDDSEGEDPKKKPHAAILRVWLFCHVRLTDKSWQLRRRTWENGRQYAGTAHQEFPYQGSPERASATLDCARSMNTASAASKRPQKRPTRVGRAGRAPRAAGLGPAPGGALSSNRWAAPRLLDPLGGRAGRSPALGALSGCARAARESPGSPASTCPA